MLTDRLQVPGKRTMLAGDVSILNGKEIAKKAKLGNLLVQMPLVDLDQQSGSIRIDFNGIGVLNSKAIPKGASHFQVKTGIVQVPEKPKGKGKFSTSGDESYFKRGDSLDLLGEIIIPYDPRIKDYLGAVMVGIYFFQESYGHYYPLKSGGAVKVLEVWKG